MILGKSSRNYKLIMDYKSHFEFLAYLVNRKMKNSQIIGSISQHLPVIVKYRFVDKEVDSTRFIFAVRYHGTVYLFTSEGTFQYYGSRYVHQSANVPYS